MDDKQPTKAQVAGVVAFYMTSALVMVFVNKTVLNATSNLIFTFLLFQCLVAVLLLRIASLTGSSRFALQKSSLEEFRHLTPVVSVGVLGLATNALCLRDVDATFFQIARGLVLPMTIAASAIHLRKLPSRKVLLAAAVVFVGFMIGVTPTSTFNSNPLQQVASMGLFWGVISSFLTACHAVMGKQQLGRQKNVVQMAYDSNLLCSMLLLPMALYNRELPALLDMFAAGNEANWKTFLIGTLITGLFGTFLSLAGLLSIKITSPVTHMFSSAMRSVIQTGLGALLFGDAVGVDRISSISVILTGTLYYTYVQSSKPSSRPTSNAERLPQHRNEKVQKD